MARLDSRLLDAWQWWFSADSTTPSSGAPSERPGQSPLPSMEQNWSAWLCFTCCLLYMLFLIYHPLQVFGMGEAACHLPTIWRARPHFCTEWQLKVALN